MKDKTLLITHPGGAHFDDITAVSFVLASYPDTEFRVERREPLEEELDDPEVWVLDVGDRYEPENRNFDHHQSSECRASFVQVAEFLGLTETMSVMPWWDFKDEVDRFGPVKSSIKFHAGDEMVNDNPVEQWLRTEFASDHESLLPYLKKYGRFLINQAQLIKKQIDVWKSCRRLDIAGVPAMICETRESAGLEEFRRLVEDPPDIVISMDRRDDGWRLFRFENTPVNFTLIKDEPEIAFAHLTGFLAKTKERIGEEDLIKLVSKAVTKHG